MSRKYTHLQTLISSGEISSYSDIWEHVSIIEVAKVFRVPGRKSAFPPDRLQAVAGLRLETVFALAAFLGVAEKDLLQLVLNERKKPEP